MTASRSHSLAIVRSLSALSLLALAACGRHSIAAPPEGVTPSASYTPAYGLAGQTLVSFVVTPAPHGSFFDRPWPSELARTEDGHLDLSLFPRGDNFILAPYVAQARRDLEGFSLSPTAYFRFSGPIAQQSLPTTLGATVEPGSPIVLMDVDPQSPERGLQYPLTFRFYSQQGSTIPANTLAVRVASGFVLRPGTLYAAVIKRSLGDATGSPLGTPELFEHIKWTVPRPDAVEERARQIHAPALETLAQKGVARDQIAALSVFRTHSPERITDELIRAAAKPAPAAAPRLLWATWDDAIAEARQPGAYFTVRGYYCTPNYQQEIDAAPFLKRGGSITLGAGGRPELALIPQKSSYFAPECGGLMRARFVLTLPRTAAPPEGFPLLVSAHGTGGDAYSFLGLNDFAGWAASEGVAVLSTDQPLHGSAGDPGARPGSQSAVRFDVLGMTLPLGNSVKPSMLFYNPLNPTATRENFRQATADAASLITLFAGLDLSAVRDAAGKPMLAALPDRPIPKLRADRVMLAGHSQGSQSLAVLGALDARVSGVILSGCGGDVRHGVLHNKEFAQLKDVLTALLGLSPGELDEFHPVLALVQNLSDAIDPATYARYYREPLPGRRPQSALHFEGLGDSYNPERAAEALAIALRAQPLGALPRPVEGISLLGLTPTSNAVRGNAAGGNATVAFSQLAPTRGEDGHFVIYYEPEAGLLITRMLRSVSSGQWPPEIGPSR